MKPASTLQTAPKAKLTAVYGLDHVPAFAFCNPVSRNTYRSAPTTITKTTMTLYSRLRKAIEPCRILFAIASIFSVPWPLVPIIILKIAATIKAKTAVIRITKSEFENASGNGR